MVQLKAISFCLIAGCLGVEATPHLAAASFQVVVGSDDVTPFPQAKHSQIPQTLLLGLTLETLP